MWNRLWEPDLGSSKLEALAVSADKLLSELLGGLLEHPASPPLGCVDLSPRLLSQDDLSLVDAFESLGTAAQPNRVSEVWSMMIVMVVRYRHYFGINCR